MAPRIGSSGGDGRPAPRRAAGAALIALDVSRLLHRAGREAPTGIDRIELAYVEHFAGRDEPLCFTAANAAGGIGLLPQRRTAAYLAALAAAWRDGGSRRRGRRMGRLASPLRVAPLLCSARTLHRLLRRSPGPPVYLLVSHDHLERRRSISRLKSAAGVRFVCLVHDLLPIEYPEYSKLGQDRRHRRRIETAAALADALIVSSTATREALEPYLRRAGRQPPVLVAPFGSEPPPAVAETAPAERPYFVLVGTIEVRKNHLLVLNLWRRLAAELGVAAPQLVLIGRRGWLAQPAFDMIDRCPGLRGLVVEHGRLDDTETAQLVRGARALLLPSFAEGFGLPLLEALSVGVPALCSDTRALRETGGTVPEYLDPLDGNGWHAAILDYAAPDSPRREAQLRRLAAWRPPRWVDHFAAVDRLMEGLAGD
jgi:glycosyltransferase involved in cell wall biosynthesis